jgi:hypothetical protein
MAGVKREPGGRTPLLGASPAGFIRLAPPEGEPDFWFRDLNDSYMPLAEMGPWAAGGGCGGGGSSALPLPSAGVGTGPHADDFFAGTVLDCLTAP